VPEGCSVAGKTLGELQLPERHGLTVLAVRRDEKTRSDLSGDLRIEAGDRLVIFGTADAFMECGELFRPPERIELRAFRE
jgi:CPA2 family monovalent cation:H+ antiporter-2